ncbi:MAG: hypothetical protein JXA18_12010 [Chitinispirillaceae bacterium]|nr:hypothetical protein [Chitinispirillaceae bacterium]
MGGQACVVYGGSEFSRDTDIAILPETGNLDKLRTALNELRAEKIAVPDLSIEFLKKGHAAHFRCKHPEAMDIRIDIMAVMRNASSFATLWERRTTMDLGDGLTVDLVSLPDLVAIKKTQRDKDWSHIRRLVEAHYLENRKKKSSQNVRFWFAEARTPEILRELAGKYPAILRDMINKRPVLGLLPGAADRSLAEALTNEEMSEREADKQYWRPLLEELERMRHKRGSQ